MESNSPMLKIYSSRKNWSVSTDKMDYKYFLLATAVVLVFGICLYIYIDSRPHFTIMKDGEEVYSARLYNSKGILIAPAPDMTLEIVEEYCGEHRVEKGNCITHPLNHEEVYCGSVAVWNCSGYLIYYG